MHYILLTLQNKVESMLRLLAQPLSSSIRSVGKAPLIHAA